MKNIFLIIFVLFFLVPSCKKLGFPEDSFSIRDIKASNCITFRAEILTLKTVDKYYLDFCQMNANFNCSPGQIVVEASLSNDTIKINEYTIEHSTSCICLHLISGKIGPLHYGTYTIVIMQEGSVRYKQDFDFYEITDINFIPEPDQIKMSP
jgi:hypothetical protein